jgi:Ribbon-helix-helix protein, copG family
MAKQIITTRLEPVLVEQVDAMARSNGVSRTQMIEELLLIALEHQESELASSFLMPRLETLLAKLLDRHLWNLRPLMVHAAVESSVASRLIMYKFKQDNGLNSTQLYSLRDQAYQTAMKSLRRKGVELEPELDVPDEQHDR